MIRRRETAGNGLRRMTAARWRLAVTIGVLAAVLATARTLVNSAAAQAPAGTTAATSTDDLGGPQPKTAGANEPKSSDAERAKGNVVEFKGIPQTPSEWIADPKQRLWLVPFVVSSIVAVWFSIERLVVLRKRRVIPNAFVERVLLNVEQGKLDAEQALKLCDENDSAVAQVFAHAVRKWGKPSVEIEQAIIDGGERAVSGLRAHLRALSFIATINPLFGLYGTVVGMILAFNDIALAGSMGRTDQLATGIGVALLTTAWGLSVAIPTQIMYTFFVGKIDGLVSEIDGHAQTLANLISAEALSGGTANASRPKMVRRPLPLGQADSKKTATAE